MLAAVTQAVPVVSAVVTQQVAFLFAKVARVSATARVPAEHQLAPVADLQAVARVLSTRVVAGQAVTTSLFCTAPAISLYCSAPFGGLASIMSANGCTDAGTNAVRYCCPSLILTQCN